MRQRLADAERRSAEAQKRSAEEKLKTINKNITTIKGFIKSIRDGLAKLEAKKKNGNVSAETERSIIDFSKREKEIVAKFDVLNKSIQNIKTEELDQQLSSSNQLVSESAKLVSAISKQQSAEARKENIQLTQIGIDKLIEFYNLYKNDPSSVNLSFNLICND